MNRITAVACAFAAVRAAAGQGVPTPPWASRDAIPSGCATRVKVPDNGRCLFDDQCESDYCCPFYRSCLNPALQYAAVHDMGDALRMTLIWGIGGTPGNTDGVQHYTASSSTDICDRSTDIVDAQDIGRCGMYAMNDDPPTVALSDSGPWIKAFDLSNAQCACDTRFQTAYLNNSWTGTFVNGIFRNYCSDDGWQYIPSDAGAANCPLGWSRIVDLAECVNATAYLGMTDVTNYLNGNLGASVRPGCAVNTLNNAVAFNKDNSMSGDFTLTATEQYLCKRSTASPTSSSSTNSSNSTTSSNSTPVPPRRPRCRNMAQADMDRMAAAGWRPVQCPEP